MDSKIQIDDRLIVDDNHNENYTNNSIFRGIPSSPGIAYGYAFVIKPETVVIPTETIEKSKINEELEKFESAKNELISEYYLALRKVQFESKNIHAVIETNILIISDPYLINGIKKRIQSCYTAESSIIQEFDAQKQNLQNSNDFLLRERAIELDNIKERIIEILRKKKIKRDILPGKLVVSKYVTPTDVVNFRDSKISAIITELGGISSHSSILARAYQIPEIIGVKNATEVIKENDFIIADGYKGLVIINPDKETLNEYEILKSKEKAYRKRLGKLISLPSETKDKHRIFLKTNINVQGDLETTLLLSTDGIGLVRTEILLSNMDKFPDEEEQYQWYKHIAEQIYPNPVTFRVFDIGSDKEAPGMPHKETNPALGFRGIRFLLYRKDILKTQFRAILLASETRNVSVMLPMITSVKEIIKSREIFEECKNQLKDEGKIFDNNCPFGVMIETPAAAIQSKVFSNYANFFSIGTNDLTQYTLAADRTNELVSDVFDSFHPAVLKLIKMTIDAAREANIPVSICGELAGHLAATSILIGMGVTELSVSPTSFLELKKRTREIKFSEAVKFADEILKCQTHDEVRKLLALN
ncbi:MAG: phosphoenolpyruvate--protein phosphotransferase [Candidatus Kapabacteria bacterium]|nr:phosphoenolpyruvate--protein phosphotransferase [Candidatus Kapabacteria bacterium]